MSKMLTTEQNSDYNRDKNNLMTEGRSIPLPPTQNKEPGKAENPSSDKNKKGKKNEKK